MKIKFSKRKTSKDYEKWFAWHPIIIYEDDDDVYYCVWLQYVERYIICYCDDTIEVLYRFMKEEKGLRCENEE